MLDEPTDLIAMPTKADVPALFATDGAIEALVTTIEVESLAIVQDYTTDKGRKAAKTLAAKVSRSKTLIDEVGKTLNDERNAANKAVNAVRNLAKERLDALRDKIKGPALAAEKVEADRVAAHMNALDQFTDIALTAQNTSGELQAQIAMIEAVVIGEAWEEYEADARAAKAAALDKLRADKAIAIAREDQAAELEALRSKQAKRDEADRIANEKSEAKEREAQRKDNEERIAKEAAETARKQAIADAEEAEKRHERALEEVKAREDQVAKDKEIKLDEYVDDLIKAIKGIGLGMIGGQPQPYGILEHDLTVRIPQEISHVGEKRWPLVEAARVEAIEAIETIKLKQQEIQKENRALADAEAAQRERDQLAQERKEHETAQNRRKADAAHRRRIRSEAVDALAKKKPANWEEAVDMMIAGEVPHVTVNF